MKCPTCGTEATRVTETRTKRGIDEKRRWRSCAFGHRFKTTEISTSELAELRDHAARLRAIVRSVTATSPPTEAVA